jgi:GNAT superfamily N-acetyltransferase
MLTFQELRSDEDISAAFPLASQLRPNLQADTFVATVRRQQQDGYRLYAGFDNGLLVVLAGVRDAHTLSRGPHLFVDDLVTLPAQQGKGCGTWMLRRLAADAKSRGLPRLYLDSRDTAIGFYRQLGFEFLTSVPCWISTDHFERADES